MVDDRQDPPLAADERTTLVTFLDWHRATLAFKCADLSAAQLRERAVPPSPMTLLGLVRHMAEVERSWFRRTFEGVDAPPQWYTPENPDGDFLDVDSASVDEAFAMWRDECDHARSVAASAPSLDDLARRAPDGRQVSLRWILVHMVEEYARHNGHADLLRERLDGRTGE